MGHFPMMHSDAIDVSRAPQREIRHVQISRGTTTGYVENADPVWAENLTSKLERKLIKSGRNWSMGCEDALAAYSFDVILSGSTQIRPSNTFFEQGQGEQS